jgi:hypothetical protein
MVHLFKCRLNDKTFDDIFRTKSDEWRTCLLLRAELPSIFSVQTESLFRVIPDIVNRESL